MEKIDIKLVDNACGCMYCVFEEDCNKGNFKPMLKANDSVEIRCCKNNKIWVKPEDEEFINKARKYWESVPESSTKEDLIVGLITLLVLVAVFVACAYI